jgi:hypothetical protein
MTTTKIEKYHVFYSANSFFPHIGLIAGSTYVGQLIFMPNGSTLPADGVKNGQVQLYYHLDDFENAIDLLRNEKPMYMFYNGSGGGFENGIQTLKEPVGEGEE